MRLATLEGDGGAQGAVLVDDVLVPLAALGAPGSVRELLAQNDAEGLVALAERAASASSDGVPRAAAELLAPVTDPEKIICIGLNYRDHAEESGQEIPAAPMWFAKFANSPLVIGREARNVAEGDALSHIAGAMPLNDVSARDLQWQNPLWTSGKAIDGF